MQQEAPPAAPQATVIPGADSLIGDLLDMDLGPPMHQQQQFGGPSQFGAPPPAAPASVSSWFYHPSAYIPHLLCSYFNVFEPSVILFGL